MLSHELQVASWIFILRVDILNHELHFYLTSCTFILRVELLTHELHFYFTSCNLYVDVMSSKYHVYNLWNICSYNALKSFISPKVNSAKNRLFVYSCKMYKQRHPRKFIPQNINFPVFLRSESSSRESFFPLKYKSSERDVSSIPIMLEYET